jgi:hypothetical protein
MKYLGWIIAFLGIALPILGQTPVTTPLATSQSVSDLAAIPDSAYLWKKTSDSDGIQIYSSKVPGTEIMALRGEGVVAAPLAKVASVIIDTTRGTEWIDSLLESKVLHKLGAHEFTEYDHMGIPFPFNPFISDRDFVSHVSMETDSLHRHVIVKYTPALDSLAPPYKNFKRGVMTCVFDIQTTDCPEETFLVAEIHCDPKGGLAAWLVNWFQGGWPETTFEDLRKEVSRPDIKVLPVVAELLNLPAGPFNPKLASAEK